MKRLVLLALAAALGANAARAGDNDWRLRIRKEVDGWSASFNGPMDYGHGSQRVRGSGAIVEKTRSLAAFSTLRIDGPIDVMLSQGGIDRATVVADDNIEPLVETAVEGDSLVVRVRRDAGFTTRRAPQVRVEAKALKAIAISGSGDLGVGAFRADALKLDISGSGDAAFALVELKELAVAITGSGDVRLAGRADVQHWSVRGSGDVDARSLAGRSATVHIRGSGDVSLGVTEQLDAQLSGSGDLSYAGRPQLRQTVTGSGEISRR